MNISPDTKRPLPMLALIALATASFMSITIEMMPSGLMHLMAPELQVQHSDIGNLVSVFALTVVLTSTPLVLLLSRIPKRTLLVVVLTIFSIGTIFTALAPNYALVAVSRVVTGVAHGVFWATVTAYTATIVRPEQVMKAVSITGGGGSLAFVLGVPISTSLGQWLGWRAAFIAVAAGCLVVVLILLAVLPKGRPGEPTVTTGAIDTEAVANALQGPQHSLRMVTLVCILTAIVMCGQYSFYSYNAPYLLQEVAITEAQLPVVQFGYGIASALAATATGMLFTSRPKSGWYFTAVLMLAGGAVLTLFPGMQPVALTGFVLWGAGMGFMPVLLQARLLAAASARQRDLAAALYNTGFNIGIASGSYLGGLLLTSFGMRAPGTAFMALLVLAIVLSIAIDWRQRKSAAAAV